MRRTVFARYAVLGRVAGGVAFLTGAGQLAAVAAAMAGVGNEPLVGRHTWLTPGFETDVFGVALLSLTDLEGGLLVMGAILMGSALVVVSGLFHPLIAYGSAIAAGAVVTMLAVGGCTGYLFHWIAFFYGNTLVGFGNIGRVLLVVGGAMVMGGIVADVRAWVRARRGTS